MPSGPALGWPEQSITRSAPKPPTMSRTFLMRASGVVTSSMFTVASAPNFRARAKRGSSGAGGAFEGADAGGQRLRQRTEPQRHVIGQLVDLGARQHVEVDIDIFRP